MTGISWGDIVAAVDAIPDCDRSWKDLVGFLHERLVALPPLPPEPLLERVLPVFRAVNGTVRRLWATAPSNLHTLGVDRVVEANFKSQRRYVLTAGPLVYGLRPAGDGWEWWIAVGAEAPYLRISMPPESVYGSRRLRGDWARHADKDALIEQRRPYEPTDPAPIVQWLDDALEDLDNAQILAPFLDEWAVRRAAEASRKAEGAAGRGSSVVDIAEGRPIE